METLKKIFPLLLSIVPFAAFTQTHPTSYDSDGDGVPDSVDKCVLVPGLQQFKGCPYAVVITDIDKDGDGVPDAIDACPLLFGPKSNKGCPDLSLIDKAANISPVNDNSPLGSSTQSTLFASNSSSEKQDLGDFKKNLLTVLASSGNMFSDIKTYKDSGANDYKTLLCLAGADECYVDLTDHYYANYGTYTDLPVALDKYDNLKQTLQLVLGENVWNGTEEIEDGVKTFSMRPKSDKTGAKPDVTLFVRQTPDNSYRVFMLVDNK